ncbi:MAG: hypothetical protein KGI98_04825 [Euryarchaeota archaeon]|nr:hypothetical protein [Euryarchaeota archaeon]MDE1879034.1 hypothetical protein [Euryarchaeota archaeon]
MKAGTIFPLWPTWVLARTTFLATAKSWRALGLLLLAFFPSILVGGLLANGTQGSALVSVYEVLVVQLFLPLVLLLVALLLAVPLLREEIDEQSMGYLVTRTLGKPAVVLGKYVGYLLLGTVFLLPSVLVTYGIVALGAPQSSTDLAGVLPSLLVSTTLGLIAYGAFYLLLGLLTRRALLVGLVYAFFWEFLLGNLPGVVPDLTVMHYLLSIPSFWVSYGPLANYATSLTLVDAIVVPLFVGLSCFGLAVMAILHVPLIPASE